jgi:hypothetical protein
MDIPRDPRRAALPYSRVTIFNSSEVQTHIVIDRYSQPHMLRPGERKHDVELPNDEIANFQEQRRPDRFYPTIDPTKPAKPKPLHPIVIEGIGPIPLVGRGYE